jgi:acetyl esterase/lipase
MAWTVSGWKIAALVGLALMVVVVGVVAVLILASFPEAKNVSYGEAGGKPLLLDIYRPIGAKKIRPGVILVHGGGWSQGDKSVLRDMANQLTKAGYVAISVGYRLAKDDTTRYPAQVDDVRRAVQWVRANADWVGIDPNRLGAFGPSAGGHLVAMLGTTDGRSQDDPGLEVYSSRVNCVVDCCGPSDFTDESSPPVGPAIADLVPNLFGKTRAQAPQAYEDASPVKHVDARSVPTLIIHGTDDDIVPIDQSRRLRDALEKAGVEVKLVEIPGEGHIFQNPGSGELLLRETLDFLGRHLKP